MVQVVDPCHAAIRLLRKVVDLRSARLDRRATLCGSVAEHLLRFQARCELGQVEAEEVPSGVDRDPVLHQRCVVRCEIYGEDIQRADRRGFGRPGHAIVLRKGRVDCEL